VNRVKKAEPNYYSSDCAMAGHQIANGLGDGSEPKPERLLEIFKDLRVRKTGDDEAEFHNALGQLRAQIDVLDGTVLDTLGERMKVAEAIGALKKEKNVAVLQSNRWNEILGKMILEGEQRGLSEEFVLKLFKSIHTESIRHQEQVINS